MSVGTEATADQIREWFDYDPETGVLCRRPKKWIRNPGVLSKTDSCGYIYAAISGKSVGAHRVAWVWVHGEWPKGQIDHINGIKTDNRIANLRDVSQRVNGENVRKASSRSRTGVLGVSPAFKNSNRFRARLRVGKLRINLGYFATPEEAHAAYLDAKRKHHEGCTL